MYADSAGRPLAITPPDHVEIFTDQNGVVLCDASGRPYCSN